MTQAEALEILKMGHSAFITGAAGSGKTYLLNKYIDYLLDHDVSVGITASTGIAATHMGGTTIHAWTGIGIKDQMTDYDIEELLQRSYLQKRISKAKVLIIDEVSMLHHFRLDIIDKVIQAFKRNPEPFGGMQVIFCGDFFQLPPVSRFGEEPALFAYHSESWKNLNPKICYLEEQHRQNDSAYLEVLNAVRNAEISEKAMSLLQSRKNKTSEISVKPTKLYSHNLDVDAENERELGLVPGKAFNYPMLGHGRENLVGILKKGCLAPETLRLKVGAQVMFVKNNFEEGYANGTLGTVVKCDENEITVRTSRGKMVRVEPANWRIEEDGKSKAEIVQYPLRLAWAITVHKSQGMSLDAAEIDLSQSFEKGMGYVALSRIKSLDGLKLLGMNEMALKVSEEVLEIDGDFREKSDIFADEFRKSGKQKIIDIQDRFLQKVGQVGQKKTKKISTTEETKLFLLQEKSIKEIAKERGLRIDTILDHADKLREKDPSFKVPHLAKGISATKLKKIQSVLAQNGMSEGRYLLSPAKQVLGESVTFDEIRIARLLMN